MAQPLPAVVGVSQSIGTKPDVALLLEWRQRQNKRGQGKWWALVARPRQQMHDAIPWTLELTWVPATALSAPPPEAVWSGSAVR